MTSSGDHNTTDIQHLDEKIESDSSGWVEMFDPPLITSDKRHYLLRLPMNDGDSGAFRQIAMITINVRPITTPDRIHSSLFTFLFLSRSFATNHSFSEWLGPSQKLSDSRLARRDAGALSSTRYTNCILCGYFGRTPRRTSYIQHS